MFRKILVANRGEIALRIVRTLHEMGIIAAVAFSDADREAAFVLAADEAYRLGSSPALESYLNIQAVIATAREAGADAVHPGYGFLAENAHFAQAVTEAGLAFIGPDVAAIKTMGDKLLARRAVESNGVSLVPGSNEPVETLPEGLKFADRWGYPVAVKAAGGGGGRGIRVVRAPRDMGPALEQAAREAASTFRNPEVYLERYFTNPRHVEIQLLGDSHGNLVHLGERDCSVQRRHQKLIEESPGPGISPELRGRMGAAALRAAESVRYTSAGTVEFLLADDGEFYFLEMNTRLQVEHAVTECVTGIDLVAEMVKVAAGEPLTLSESVGSPNGHAIEVRINAEDPALHFQPTPGPITVYREPGGIGVRVDSGVFAGYTIPDAYDSLIAKLIVWAPDREGTRRRAVRALDEFQVLGPETTIQFARAVLQHPVFAAGNVGTAFVEDYLEELILPAVGSSHDNTAATGDQAAERGPSRSFEVEVNRRVFRVQVAELHHVSSRRQITGSNRRSGRLRADMGDQLISPMHGTVVALLKRAGERVSEGDPVAVIEAMKMENEVGAHRSGTVKSLLVHIGDTVESGEPIAKIV